MSKTDIIIHDEKDNVGVIVVDKVNNGQECECWIMENNKSIKIQNEGLKIAIKKDRSPVTNGDLEVNKILTEKISQLTPSFPIISEETVDLEKKNKLNTFWLIDPIDGTKEYIAGKDEYTLNAGLIIDNVPAIGLVGVPKKKR